MKDIKKIIYIILVVIVIIGCLKLTTQEPELDLRYSKSKQIQISMEQQFNNNDIKEIIKEVTDNNEILIQKIEIYKETVSIIVREIKEEQIEEIIYKINEKYNLNNTKDDVLVTDIPMYNFSDMILPYVLPIVVSLILILIYAIIKYRQINVLEILAKIIGFNIIAFILYISFLAITRFPIDVVTIPIGVCIYTVITYIVINNFENRIKANKTNEKKK